MLNQEIMELIQRRRLQLLVNSCIYYEMNNSIISDEMWDKWARELVQLQTDYPEESKAVIWYNAFENWDASTGAFLPLKDEWVVAKAKQLLGYGGKPSNDIHIVEVPKARKTVQKQEVKKVQKPIKRKLF